MRSGTIAFLLGIISLQFFAALPSFYWVAALPLAMGALGWARVRLLGALAAGFLWCLLHAHWTVSHDWPTGCEGKDLFATGTVMDIPELAPRRTRFLFRIETLQGCDAARLPVRLRVSWFGASPRLRAGERWQLTLRAKGRRGWFNPGGFDYERWLLQQRIGGSGYVRNPEQALQIGKAADPAALLQRARQQLFDRLDAQLPYTTAATILPALALGERSRIRPEQWQVLRATGTSHLIAISGLHIGLAAGFGGFLGWWCWRRSAWLCSRVPAQQAALVPALALAVVYAALAGFSLPTQRAVLMLAVAVLAQALRRHQAPGRTWFVALLAVLVWDPLAVLSPGFWLSFGAVAVLLYGMGQRWSIRGLWWKWGRAQWLVGVGLVPLSLAAFNAFSVAGPLANLVAVPWVSLVVVPLTLLGTACGVLLPDCAGWLLHGAGWALETLWPVLAWLAKLPGASHSGAADSLWLLPALLGATWMLAPKGFPGRALGVLLLLPLWNPAAERPLLEGEVMLTLLDTGQDVAVVVRTRNHSLVYGAGRTFVTAGERVVWPYLRRVGMAHIDTLVVSRDQEVHLAGQASAGTGISFDRIYVAVPGGTYPQRRCRAGAAWRWDGVAFQFLHPATARVAASENDSCVLRVETADGSVLLTGDLPVDGARLLLRQSAAQLRSDILVSPPQGAGLSSGPSFMGSVAPSWILYATDRQSRIRAWHTESAQRPHSVDARILSTARCGAITLRLRPGIPPRPGCSRAEKGRYWNLQ